jgi:hypothetical protein
VNGSVATTERVAWWSHSVSRAMRSTIELKGIVSDWACAKSSAGHGYGSSEHGAGAMAASAPISRPPTACHASVSSRMRSTSSAGSPAIGPVTVFSFFASGGADAARTSAMPAMQVGRAGRAI